MGGPKLAVVSYRVNLVAMLSRSSSALVFRGYRASIVRYVAEWDMAVVAHHCGYPLSRYTCRATRVAADFLDFIAFCRCSTGVALHPLKILVSHLPPRVPGGVAPKFGSEKVSRYTGVSQLQLRVSRYTVQLRIWHRHVCVDETTMKGYCTFLGKC